jgi:serine/threonine protein kinase
LTVSIILAARSLLSLSLSPWLSLDVFESSSPIREYVLTSDSTLEHPCVTQVYGACPDPAQLMIIMEYVPHGNLADYLRKAAVERRSLESLYPLVYRVALDVAHALTYLHNSTNFIFRDLKPANILVWHPSMITARILVHLEGMLTKLS